MRIPLSQTEESRDKAIIPRSNQNVKKRKLFPKQRIQRERERETNFKQKISLFHEKVSQKREMKNFFPLSLGNQNFKKKLFFFLFFAGEISKKLKISLFHGKESQKRELVNSFSRKSELQEREREKTLSMKSELQ